MEAPTLKMLGPAAWEIGGGGYSTIIPAALAGIGTICLRPLARVRLSGRTLHGGRRAKIILRDRARLGESTARGEDGKPNSDGAPIQQLHHGSSIVRSLSPRGRRAHYIGRIIIHLVKVKVLHTPPTGPHSAGTGLIKLSSSAFDRSSWGQGYVLCTVDRFNGAQRPSQTTNWLSWLVGT